MAPLAECKDPIELPDPSVWSVKEFIPDLVTHPDTPIGKLLEPYKDFEAQLRKAYARQPTHEALKDGKINLIPIFDNKNEQSLKIRGRSLDSESDDERSRYIMELKDEARKPDNAPAVVASFKDFQQNFNLFSESSLSDLDWNNVVAAGSSVTTALLPVPEKWAGSKRSMREYYHEHLAPASDVDLFLYGLNEEEGLEKIKQIERNIKDSILHETTTIRTKNAITIASQYPTRHVQIVLRLYDSISQIITGFDVDCACLAYDGSQVYAAPRALAAFVTQCNTIDLTRRSPSYENRLSKYSRRGFEVHWPLLDRTRIDPTIFERSFGRTQGLARLLILEKLPKTQDRDNYMDQRRAERGRPALHRNYYRKMGGNIKDQEEDDVAEWVDHEEVASYHTMTVPYGPKYHAHRINRLLYAKDLLLNAEWNKPEDRKVHLHRHPCFFGTAEEILQDCCGYCPVPKSDEEIEVAEEESKVYISGPLKFIMDDPGRQEIGSFNPITDDEWTTMAYVGDTARLCQAIVDGDLEHVEDWCSQEGVDVNRRDYTGRTPLHLAVMTSTPQIVQCLIDCGARLIARLVDGRTALHLAAARGSKEMVKALMDRSLANEEEEDKVEARRAARNHAKQAKTDAKADDEGSDAESEASDLTLESEESDSMTMGSFVKVDKEKENQDDGVPDDSAEEPDILEVDVIAWDYGLSPLHLAILNAHLDIIELLVSEYGADVLLPVKLLEPGTKNARGAIMTILLAMALPTENAKAVVKLLLDLGATSSQADMNHTSVLHYIVAQDNHEILDLLLTNDRPVARSVLNWMTTPPWGNQGDTPLTSAISMGHENMVSKLLSIGAKPEISHDSWVKTYLNKNTWARTQSPEDIKKQFNSNVIQPIISAAGKEMGKTIEDLLAHGADPLTLERSAYSVVQNPENARYTVTESLLDIIQKKLQLLGEWKEPSSEEPKSKRNYFSINQLVHYRPRKPEKLRDESYYTDGLTLGTYAHWTAQRDFRHTKYANKREWKAHEDYTPPEAEEGLEEKKAAISKLIKELEHAEMTLIEAGGKTFAELYPDIPKREEAKQQVYPEPKPTFYETKLRFRVPDLNDTKSEGYVKLFEAAWDNDLERIKSLTLGKWSLDDDDMPLNSPLKIAVQDGSGFSPFSIAVLRGHRELAKKIVEICATQYHKDDGLSTKQRFRTTADSDDEDYEDNEDENSNGLPIFSELVNDKFTVDNLGEVSNMVKSDVLPLSMIEWPCRAQRFLDSKKSNHGGEITLLQHAVEDEDMDLLKFIIEIGGEQKALLAEDEDDQTCYTVSSAVFYAAVKLGRTAMLAEMIKATGVGIPLNELIATSGVEIKTKPRYYQGLSVGGKKRADWAQAPGGYQRVVEEKTPPLLQAAKLGSIDAVEWFMSDAPMRRYKEFAESNKHDKRIKTLEEAGKGFDKTIGSWLAMKSELTLHCAILYNPGKEKEHPEYLALIKHLVSVVPDCLEQKSSEGWTPLHLAAHMHREDVVSYLISVGANQRSRDKAGRNMAHSMLVDQGYQTARNDEKDAKELKQLLELFDKAALKEMLLERCSQAPGALTPLAYWMAKNGGDYKKADVVEVLTSYSSGEELEMINGEGDLPLHVAVKQALTTITFFLLTLNSSLLHRENSTGRTPLEMSREIYIASQVQSPPNISNGNHFNQYRPNQHDYNSVVNRAASSFVKKEEEESKKRTWEVCQSKDEELVEGGGEGRKRRLVSLFEANEVARRVAGLKRGSGGGQMVVNGGLVEDGKPDIVSEWAGDL